MENPDKIGRLSSCRGVAFEIKPHSDPFAITTPAIAERHGSKRQWLPWGSFSKIVPSSSIIQKSTSRASSHFCDLELEGDDEDDDTLNSLEEGNEEEDLNPVPLPLPASKSHSQLPPKAAKPKDSSRLSIIQVDQGLFTVYKRLFVVRLALNITDIILAATRNFSYARRRATLFSIGNILTLTLCRSEAFLRVVFWLVVKIFGRLWVHLPLKTALTSLLESLGGIHSSCGVSSIAWLVNALVLTLKDRENSSTGIVWVASTILSLLAFSALVWALIILTISYDPKTKSYSNQLGSRLIKQQEFWFTVAITLLIILPWLTVRRVAVKVSAPSTHASIIKFQGGVKEGVLGRISPSPLSERHAFGIISDNKKEHIMLAGAVGDFTKSLVSNPPSHLWVRQVHFAGLPYLVNVYDRVLLVTTSWGICVFLSFLLQPCTANNFGKEIKDWVSGYPKEKVIVHDTAVLGRPNVSQMSVNTARNWKAEVVIVTSNPEGSRDVVNA
ncbi:adenylate-forming reductase 03009-like [Camellia sinensis]|uniref:adenylate-forming reductase 03009-like n=1 Tax=Camellia sinensis TaxID=4442 RepID=UPI001036281F|nr:adenylate-forming reductase 03009-like [Camellia sinensis]